MESFGRKDGPCTAPGAEVSGWRTEGSRGESSFPAWVAGRTVEPFPEPRNLGKEWSGRAEILRSLWWCLKPWLEVRGGVQVPP